MFPYILTLAQLAVLVIVGILLWQIWKLLRCNDLGDDKPLSELQVAALQKKLRILMVLAVTEAVISITRIVLRYLEGL